MDSTVPDSGQPLFEHQLHEALSRAVDNAARTHRIATAARAELIDQLAADDLRALADISPEVETQLARARAQLAAEQKAAEEWQETLKAAVRAR